MSARQTVYRDIRGAEMPFMTYETALDHVISLATDNQISENDLAVGDKGLRSQAEWQDQALDTVTKLKDKIAVLRLVQRPEAHDWPRKMLRADRAMDPTQPLSALKICLAMAEDGAIDPEGADGVEMADQIDIQQQAFDVIRDLIGDHHELIAGLRMDLAPSPKGS